MKGRGLVVDGVDTTWLRINKRTFSPQNVHSYSPINEGRTSRSVCLSHVKLYGLMCINLKGLLITCDAYSL